MFKLSSEKDTNFLLDCIMYLMVIKNWIVQSSMVYIAYILYWNIYFFCTEESRGQFFIYIFKTKFWKNTTTLLLQYVGSNVHMMQVFRSARNQNWSQVLFAGKKIIKTFQMIWNRRYLNISAYIFICRTEYITNMPLDACFRSIPHDSAQGKLKQIRLTIKRNLLVKNTIYLLM